MSQQWSVEVTNTATYQLAVTYQEAVDLATTACLMEGHPRRTAGVQVLKSSYDRDVCAEPREAGRLPPGTYRIRIDLKWRKAQLEGGAWYVGRNRIDADSISAIGERLEV